MYIKKRATEQGERFCTAKVPPRRLGINSRLKYAQLELVMQRAANRDQPDCQAM
jgi:hypothetical protein